MSTPISMGFLTLESAGIALYANEIKHTSSIKKSNSNPIKRVFVQLP
jgi:hypothetical protein